VWRILFRRELAAWARAGCTLSLWWRDDDARRPTPQLDRLLALSEQYDVPVTLAVIPSAASGDLARRIRDARLVSAIQHGIDHVDRAKATERGAREMATEWDAQEIATRLETTRRELQCMPNSFPVFVPPWNVTHPCLEAALRSTGFRGWSPGRAVQQSQGLVRIDTHVEVLRWKGGVRFRGEACFMRRLIRLAHERRCAGRWTEPIGILTHHLQQDEPSWEFFERFIRWTKGNTAIEWRSLSRLLDPSSLVFFCWVAPGLGWALA
jgi:hypothetical protein